MKCILVILAAMFFLKTFSQHDKRAVADSITQEGLKLFRSEMASWYGTDIFMEKAKSEREEIGGYFSYADGKYYKCVFYSNTSTPTVLGTITFKGSYDPSKAALNLSKRSFTETELSYYSIRKAALDEIAEDTSMFVTFKNTNLNLIPLIEKGSKKVYVLTGTSRSDIVIIGNDYLLTFDEQNKLVSKRKIHANVITLPTEVKEKDADGSTPMGSVHNHIPETGEYITATDICTFMLYGRFTNWKQQLVISEHYLSIWNCETNKLIIVPTGR